jgi:membrane protein
VATFKDKLADYPLIQRFVGKIQTTSLPGFGKIPIYDVAVFFGKEAQRDNLTVRASATAFNLLLGLFPSIIFLFTLVSYMPVDNPDKVIYNFIHEFLPDNASAFLLTSIDDLSHTNRGGVLASVILMSFFFSTRGVNSLINAFNKKQPTFKNRNFIKNRLAAFRLTAYLFLLFLGSIILIIAGSVSVDFVSEKLYLDNQIGRIAIRSIKWVLIVLLFFSTISLIYHYGPATKKKWRFITPGATFATALSVMASLIFSFFVNKFGFHNEFYGSIGTLVVLMLWMFLNCLVLIVGFELNNSIDMNLTLRNMEEDQDEEPI